MTTTAVPTIVDYKKYYDIETYLLSEVGPIFRYSGTLDHKDFYLILVWKANHAKSYAKKRLAAKAGTFAEAVRQIADALHKATNRKQSLEILMRKWGFRLATWATSFRYHQRYHSMSSTTK